LTGGKERGESGLLNSRIAPEGACTPGELNLRTADPSAVAQRRPEAIVDFDTEALKMLADA
jgi:hypothetical protein